MTKFACCDGWEFTPQWSEDFLHFRTPAQSVRLPHTVAELPIHYADSDAYQLLCGYRRRVTPPPGAEGQRLFLQLDGAAHIATVFVNGQAAATHRCGYTAFRVELTEAADSGASIELAIRLDTTENASIPPFGYVIDYLTYGGLYRPVWLEVCPQRSIQDLFLYTPALDTAHVSLSTEGAQDGDRVQLRILDAQGVCQAEEEAPAADAERTLTLTSPLPWDTEHPHLYTCQALLLDKDGRTWDTRSVDFGFRTAQFRADGFYLNGKKTFLRGLNRHQCWPYVGYAVPDALQREDARILKQELQCNAVRTSHYPQSQAFLDACDRLGLLVFTEIPGWQHIGDEDWKEQACQNTREMVLQYRNHPSIVLWGVRINESQDDDDFYRRTNAIAHALDPSRATSGVRYLEGSSLLEDVYAFNDFSHTGQNAGARPKEKVTPDTGKALLISECNGHMYPTKPWDSWAHRQEHALRHARVQDAALASGVHAGCFGWCMFDYPTHKDFGSGDRVCYHGVLDAFRNPKLAAALFASQGEETPVLEVGSSMDIGDYPGGQIGTVWVFSNADEVRLYKNDRYVTTLTPGDWKGLPHGPMPMEDTIGALLESEEGLAPKHAALVRQVLLSAQRRGLSNLTLRDKARMLWCMLRYHNTVQDGVELYGKYVSNWGGSSTVWRFDALRGGQVVSSVTRCPNTHLHLEVRVSHTALVEADTYDMAAVRIRVLDENGSCAPYAQLPLRLTLTGDAALVGPDLVCAEGGMTGTYLRTLGRAGTATLTVSGEGLEPVTLPFTIEIRKD